MSGARTTTRLSVYDGREYCGFILRRAGVFKNVQAAATELWRVARGQA